MHRKEGSHNQETLPEYSTCSIISPACLFITTFFIAVYKARALILETIYVVEKEILQKNLWFIIKIVFKSRMGYNGVCMALKYIRQSMLKQASPSRLWQSQPGTIHFLIGKFSYFVITFLY